MSKEMKLNLGCGSDRKKGYVNIDINPEYRPDIVYDVSNLKRFKNNSVKEVYASHILEHLDDPVKTITEWARVLKPGGKLIIKVPHWHSGQAWSDPTHKRAFTFDTFKWFVRGHFAQKKGNSENVQLFSSVKLSGLKAPLFWWLPFKPAVWLSERVGGVFWEIRAELRK